MAPSSRSADTGRRAATDDDHSGGGRAGRDGRSDGGADVPDDAEVRRRLREVDDPAAYAARLGDGSFWRPLAAVALRDAGLPAQFTDRFAGAGGGSFPVLRTGHGTVVKVYPPFLDGAACAATEPAALAALAGVAVPRPLATGELRPGGAEPDAGNDAWPWPYLVMSEVAGASIHQLRRAGAIDDELQPLARFAGQALRAIWATPVPTTGGRLRPGWAPFAELLHRRRVEAMAGHRAAGRLSPRLCDRLEDWLPAVDALLDGSGPAVLLHGDLHGDHVLGRRGPDGTITPTGVIDLSDAIAGHPAYDLVALHLDAFRASRSLLRTVVDELPATVVPSPQAALAWSVLHEFDPFERWEGERAAWLRHFDEPDELAEALWAT